jgi:hypothetical protein
LKDLNANLKVKAMKENGGGVCFLVYSILGVKGVCWSSRVKIKTNDKWVNYSHGPAQTKQQVG